MQDPSSHDGTALDYWCHQATGALLLGRPRYETETSKRYTKHRRRYSTPMSTAVLTALISASAAVITAITALLLNYRGFSSIDSRFATLENRITGLENRIDRRLENIEADLKEFFKVLADHDKRIGRLEDKQ